MSNGNREFKSDVFSMLMEDKTNALSVYNVLNGTDLTDPDELEIHTLDKGVSLTVRNDADNTISMEELGNLSGRFNYEFACLITPRVPRIYHN